MGSKLVTCAISSGEWTRQMYDWPEIFKAVDFVNLMTYDLLDGKRKETQLHTALYSSKPDVPNVDAGVQVVLNSGIDKRKLIMGLGTYGHTFILNDPSKTSVGAPATQDETWNYYNICKAVNSEELKYQYDDDQQSAYAFAGTQWVGYDDVRAVTEKAKYINNMGLGGAMFWAVDNDDFSNACGGGRFPLIAKVYSLVVSQNRIENVANLEPIVSQIQSLMPNFTFS